MVSIFNDSQLLKYIATRLSGNNVSLSDILCIKQYNGGLPDDLEKKLPEDCVVVQQQNVREPLYFSISEGTLFIPQYSGFGRAGRYKSMIQALQSKFRPDLEYEVVELEGKSRRTNIAYDNYAYDFVVGLFVPEPKHEDRRVFADYDISNVRKIIFGSLAAVRKQANQVRAGKSDYLESQIVNIRGEDVLNIGYVYSDQAGRIIDKILREYDAIGRDQGMIIPVELYMFGRAGGLLPSMKRHDIVYPTGSLSEANLSRGRKMVHPVNNSLADNCGYSGTNLNVVSVIDESFELLVKACDSGCVSVEMELRASSDAVEKARELYHNIDVSFGFAAHISDLPLTGDTVAEELDSDVGEQAALGKIIERIFQ